jgi:penicillin amidase
MARQLGKWMSMRWTAQEPSDEESNFLGLGYARNAGEWLQAMNGFVAPTQNGLVADRSGNIAIRSSGGYPIRPGDGRGDVVRDGSKSSNDWVGYLPPSKFPYSMNPAQGFLASANQQPVDPRVNPSFMGSDWYSPWRALRINELLRVDSAVTPDAMRRFQTDPGSPRADAFVPQFLGAAAREDSAGRSDATLRRAAALLSEWDRRYTKDNRRAVLFEMAMDELASRTWDELLPERVSDSTAKALTVPESQVLLELMHAPTSKWWDNGRTAKVVETRDAIIAQSLRAALVAAVRMHGDPSSKGWLWSHVRRLNIHHLAKIPEFSVLDLPVSGGPSTLSPSGGSGKEGASWRMVVELGPEVRAWATYPGGQSGNPASARYTDRLPLWESGTLAPVLFPRTSAELDPKRITSVLRLDAHQ